MRTTKVPPPNHTQVDTNMTTAPHGEQVLNQSAHTCQDDMKQMTARGSRQEREVEGAVRATDVETSVMLSEHRSFSCHRTPPTSHRLIASALL